LPLNIGTPKKENVRAGLVAHLMSRKPIRKQKKIGSIYPPSWLSSYTKYLPSIHKIGQMNFASSPTPTSMINILLFPQYLLSPPPPKKKFFHSQFNNIQIMACHTIQTLLKPNFYLRRDARKLSNKISIVSGNTYGS
jgi:hypothetical protein